MKVAKYLSPFLKSKDIKKPVVVTITKVTEESFKGDDGKERKSVALHFKQLDQALVTCKESLAFLIDHFETDESNDWIGKDVELFFDADVKYQGKRIGGIRIREAK